MDLFLSLWLKLFFVLTPFFALTMFLTLSEGYSPSQRQHLACNVALAVSVICLILFFLGGRLFILFGITLDSFRVGAGILLMLSGINLVQGRSGAMNAPEGGGITVVPLAIPIIVGPATIGILLVKGAELSEAAEKLSGCLAMLAAVFCMGLVLLSADVIQKMLGDKGIAVLSRLTGLILTAMAAQMIMIGIQSFFNLAV
ncbi:MarC family protein [Kiritimatiellaeota bacterium B1221]|nr:MarC family protein [Kiritimatiellaeota bacterium B1221]